mmetsp:Transcript_37657/g.67823  ORF Transcript_37657/g.67823 Transcript_37657/m.67823 type:complete len:245 (+) Transcript_37657:1255-1989(+)
MQSTHGTCHGRACHGNNIISSRSHSRHPHRRSRTTAAVSPRSDIRHPHQSPSTSGAICPHQRRHIHKVHSSCSPEQLRSLRHETLRRGNHIGFDLLHPLALLLGIVAGANEGLLHLLRLLKVDVHFPQNGLRGILDILENILQLRRVFLVEHLAFLRHGIFGLGGERIFGGNDEAVGVVIGAILSRGVELFGVRHETFVGVRLGRRCHANAALIRGAASHRAIVVAAVLLVIVGEVHSCYCCGL